MAKWANTIVLDAYLDKISTANKLLLCSSQPATRAAALSAALASADLTGASFTKANGSPNGRQVTIAEQANMPVTATGTANHVALIDGTDVLVVTTVTSQSVTSGNTATVPAWKASIALPT